MLHKSESGLRILIADDHPLVLRGLMEALGTIKEGVAVEGAEGLTEVLDLLERSRYDLVLLDLMMPDMDGWEVYQQMKADGETRDIPVVVVTAKAQSIDKVLGLHIAKVDDYIAKPFSPQELLNSVEKVLGRSE